MLPWLPQTRWPDELKVFLGAHASDPTLPPRTADPQLSAEIQSLADAAGGARRGDQLRAALYLAIGDLHASHELSQNDSSAMGSLLHGIMHRREGDFSNSLYWFNRCRSIDLSETIGQGYSPDGLTAAYEQAFVARGGQLQPRRGADHDKIIEDSWREWRAVVDRILAV